MTGAALVPAVATDSLEQVREAVAFVCRAPLADLKAATRPAEVSGWDSFGRLQVVLELERRIGRELPLERAVAADSLAELAALLDEVGP